MAWWRSVILAGLLAGGLGGPAQAQDRSRGSRNLPLDHWGYQYLQRLVTRGYLADLNPLVQPYRRIEIAQGLSRLGPDSLPEPVAGWVRMLRQEFRDELEALAGRPRRGWGLEVQAGAHGSTSRRLDAVRALGDGKAWPWVRGGGWVETGPIAVEARGLNDRYFRDDPDGLDAFPGGYPRSDNAYLAAAFPVGNVTLGRLTRNWGPLGGTGLMVSDGAGPYTQLGLDLASGRFSFHWLVGELDTLQKTDTVGHRYLVAHRLDYSSRNLTVSLGESSLYAWPDGGMRLRMLNPMAFLYFDSQLPPFDQVNQNTTFDAQVWWRRGGLVLYAEGLLDDIDLTPDSQPAEPPEYAFAVGGRLTSLSPGVELGWEYEQVSAWAYRTNHIVDRYSYLNRGLGANYSDYDRLSVWADLYPPLPGLRVSPTVVLQRQGKGNFRDPNPGSTYAGQPALFLGVIERTLRPALRGRYQPARFAWVSWDVGPNFVHNAAHAPGVDQTKWEATGEIGFRWDFPRSIPQ